MQKGKLFVIAGPSGVGKGTLIKKIFEKKNNFILSISMTTRKPRKNEVDGREYFFVSKEKFLDQIKEKNFLEYEEFFGNYYGTPRDFVFSNLEKGMNVILEIDTNGAFQIKKNFNECIMIFIMPPSIEELRKRIMGRGAEDEHQIKKRIEKAELEIKDKDKFKYVIVNDNLKETEKKFLEIIEKEEKNE